MPEIMAVWFSDRERSLVVHEMELLLSLVEEMEGPLEAVEAKAGMAVGLAVDGPRRGEWFLLISEPVIASLTVLGLSSTIDGGEGSE